MSSTEQWIVPVTRLATVSRTKAATLSSGGGSQSSFGSRVSFQWSQICRLSSVSRSISGKPCALANRSAPSPTSRQCRVRCMTSRATAAGCMMLRIEATEPPPCVGPCMTAASSSTTPSSLGRPPKPTEWSLGSASTIATPSIAASSGSCPFLISSIAFSTDARPLPLATTIGFFASGRLDRRRPDRQRAQARRGRRGHEMTSVHVRS